MPDLRVTLVADGASDSLLEHHLRWLLAGVGGASLDVRFRFAVRRAPGASPLAARLAAAIRAYPCDVLAVHRDAEAQPPQRRYDEIQRAWAALPPAARPAAYLPVVPVRMTEAWLLFDEAAIREAAGNPHGSMPLGLPKPCEAERLANPKRLLHGLLRDACGLNRQRQRRFDAAAAVLDLGRCLDDFRPLLACESFLRLETDLRRILREQGYA